MKYSVIIPAYNCEQTLPATINSILQCGLTNFEILIIDDGSTDRTLEICDQFVSAHGNIRCLHKENGGVSSARNCGLSAAVGNYVWFFDSDDSVDPGSMERADQIINEHAPDMLIFGLSFDFYRNGTRYARWEYSYPHEGLYSSSALHNVFFDLYQCNSLTSTCNKLIKREVLIDNQLAYDETLSLMEDFLLSIQVLAHCKTVFNLPQVIYRYYFSSADSGEKDKAVIRVSRIGNLEEYLLPFQNALAAHPDVMSSLYYMLLAQRLRYQRLRQIRVTADHFCAGPFSKDIYYELCPSGSKATADHLLRHRHLWVYLHYRFRRKATAFLRKTHLFKLLKKIK